jgi:hypothetical protein
MIIENELDHESNNEIISNTNMNNMDKIKLFSSFYNNEETFKFNNNQNQNTNLKIYKYIKPIYVNKKFKILDIFKKNN